MPRRSQPGPMPDMREAAADPALQLALALRDKLLSLHAMATVLSDLPAAKRRTCNYARKIAKFCGSRKTSRESWKIYRGKSEKGATTWCHDSSPADSRSSAIGTPCPPIGGQGERRLEATAAAAKLCARCVIIALSKHCND